MAQTQIASSKAETYRWGVECFLPDRAINELGISIQPSQPKATSAK